jgi:two-component system nitrate/nitrite response regulator NarL
MQDQNSKQSLVYINSRHPFVVQTMEGIIRSDSALSNLRVCSQLNVKESTLVIQIVDGFSVPEWRAMICRRQSPSLRSIVVLPQNSLTSDDEHRALQLGVHGIVYFSPTLHAELPEAIHAVLAGRLWVKWDVPGSQGRRQPVSTDLPANFTLREEQIVDLMFRGLANKSIGDVLEISERTVKFHVSNILHKFQVSSRRQLLTGGATFQGDYREAGIGSPISSPSL